ncbi:acyltransferase [Ruminococcus sp.]|uniref:acyltransferase n=1 Tax=Ruminococcus sp. TaxID=41978 RepID=UPI003F037D82
MDIQKLQSRNAAMDIIRIVAAFTVLSVHFFLHNGFYSQTVEGAPMYIMVLMRTLFSVCVPLFMILTGYLMSHKTLSRKYYSGISKTLIIFVLATLACMIFKAIHDNESFTLKSFILGTLDFTGANYSWYIEMYIGLFLLIPFLNLAYNKLKNKRQKQVLVLTLVFLTIIPTVFNIFNFDNPAWWSDPKTSDTFAKLIPSWWMGIYPITYYFTGCYIREYGIKLKTSSTLVLFLLAILIFGTFNYYRSYGTTFKSGSYVFWYGIEPYVLSVLLFVLLSRIKTDNMNEKVKFVLWKVSDLALGIYLISYIFDMLVYPVLNAKINPMTDRLPFYFVAVPIVFVCSMLASAIMNIAAKYIQILFKKLVGFIKAQRQRADKYKWQDYLFIALMAGGLIFAFWKCVFGFGGNDEAFYLTVPQRFNMGDALIKDEWHLSQMSGFLLMPFVWLFTTVTGSTEGIILAARVLYILFHATVSVIIYLRIRKYGYVSVFASVLYFIYTPYDIMAMSYNTMGLDFVTLSGVIMGTASYKKKLPLIVSGVAFAAAVLCCPYLAVAYILYGICVLIHTFIKNRDTKFILKSELFAGKTFLFFSIGIFALAAVFLIFALTRVSIKEIIDYLPYLMTDPEHPQIALGTRFSMYFNSIYNCHSHFKIALFSYLAMIIIMIIDRKRKYHRSLYLIVTTAIVIFCYVLLLPQLTYSTYNAIMFPLIFIGITSYILCENKPKPLFASLFVLGIIYSFAICFSSNQYFYVISMVITASNIASYVFLAQLLREMKTSQDNIEYAVWVKKGSFLFVAFMIFLQGAFQITVKAEHCFWESGNTSNLTAQIQNGPAKGIYTNVNNCNTYEQIYSDLQYYKSKPKDKILFLTAKTWCYLAAEFPYGTLSAWISGENPSSVERLKTYYSVNPEEIPKYIYIPKDSQWDFTNIYNDAYSYGYSFEENEISYKLEKIN